MKKIVKIVLLGLVALAAAASAVYYITAPAVLPLTAVTPKTARLSFTEQGLFTAETVMRVYPLVQGSLAEVLVEEGQTVRAGDVLCVIDAAPLRMKIDQLHDSIKGYEAQARALEAQEKSANATVEERLRLQGILIEQSENALARAQTDLARAEFLYEDGSLSQAERDAAQAAVEQCESALRAQRQELAVIAAGKASGGTAEYYRALIEVERANIAQLERDVENCRVTASVGGVITGLEVKGVNYVSGGVPVAEITTWEDGAIETFVTTKDVDGIRVGDTVELTLKRRTGDLPFTGTVDSVEAHAELRLSALGLEERRVKVRILPSLADLDGELLGPGFDVEVSFLLYNEENQLTVPKSALYQENGADMLWVVRNGRAQPVPVRTGMELRTETVIESGLSSGDLVVTDANNKILKSGLKVVAG